jgi:zinc protease
MIVMHLARRAGPVALLALALMVWTGAARADIEVVTTPAGIVLWLEREPTIPMVSLNFAFRGGSSLDPAGREGVANMVSGLLDEGAGDLDSQAFRDRLDELSVKLGFDSGRDAFYGSLTTLTENLDAAFDLLAAAVNAPRFDPEPVERVRGQILIGIAYDQEDPDSVAWGTWNETAFPDHAYGRAVAGTPESVAAIATEDLRSYLGGAFARDRLVIAAVGDIDADRLAVLVDKVFAGLPATGAPLLSGDVEPHVGETVVVDMDVPQSSIVFGLPALKRDDPDFYALNLLNKALGGGGLNTRLFEEVRNERGLAYSASTFIYALDHAGLLLGSAGTQSARAGETLDVIKAILADVALNGITLAELDDARAYLTGSFPLALDSNGKIARTLVAIQMDDLGLDYLDKRNGFYQAVTLDDVNRVAARYLDPDNLLIVVTGRPEGVDSTTAAVD